LSHFIVFEGIDGSGKSTLIDSLAELLKQKAQQSIITREPGGTPLAEELRQILLRIGDDSPVPRSELFLYEASRAQHVDQLIKPALDSGKWVLCDRFTASSVAFQSFGRGLPLKEVEMLNEFAIDSCRPELTVLLDLPVEESLKRRTKREDQSGVEADRFEREEQVFHQKVRDGYLNLAKQESNWLVIDATQGPTEVFSQLSEHLKHKGWLS